VVAGSERQPEDATVEHGLHAGRRDRLARSNHPRVGDGAGRPRGTLSVQDCARDACAERAYRSPNLTLHESLRRRTMAATGSTPIALVRCSATYDGTLNRPWSGRVHWIRPVTSLYDRSEEHTSELQS